MKKLLAFQHIQRENPSNIGIYAEERGITLDIVKLWEPTAIPDVSLYDGLVVLGGPMGVYETYSNKKEELHALANAIGNIPILGFCLGAQLLAHALGSAVYPNKKRGQPVKEIGYSEVVLTSDGAESPIFQGFDSTLTVLQWHGDTFDVPKGAKLLATSPSCTNQAFSYSNAYGLQFHLEASPEMVEEWAKADSKWTHTDFDLDEAKMLAEAHEKAAQMKEQCYALMDNFLS